jgi:hypothetical protein
LKPPDGGAAPLLSTGHPGAMDWRPPPDYGRTEPMPAAEQLQEAHAQLDVVVLRELVGARWAIHPRDLAELRRAIGDAERLHGLWFLITAHPDLEGQGPQLVWENPAS